MPKSKPDQAKDIPISGTTFGEILGAVLKVRPNTGRKKKAAPKKATKRKAK